MITNIRKSCCERGFDLVTAIFLSRVGYDAGKLRSLDEKSLLVLRVPRHRRRFLQLACAGGIKVPDADLDKVARIPELLIVTL